MRPRLHHIEPSIVVGALYVLGQVVVELLNLDPDLSYVIHEIEPEGLVSEQLLLVVSYSEFRCIMHGVAIEKSSSCETCQVLTIRVTPKDKARGLQPNRLVREGVDMSLLGSLIIGKAEGLAGHLGDKGFSEAKARLHIDLIFLSVGRIRRMDDVGVLCRDDLLDEDSHEYLMQAHSDLLGGKESPFVELASPDHLYRFPGLPEILLLDTKDDQLLLEVGQHRVRRNELNSHDQILASIEQAIHLFHALSLRKLVDVAVYLIANLSLQVQSVL